MLSQTYMQIAYLIAKNSKCVSWKVGALIEKDGRIISTGFNGTPAGQENCSCHAHKSGWLDDEGKMIPEKRPEHSAWSHKNEIHAELNAILFAARSGVSIEGASMWCTASPCPDCAKAIANSGIKHIYYCDTYDRNGGRDWADILNKADITVTRIPKALLTDLKGIDNE